MVHGCGPGAEVASPRANAAVVATVGDREITRETLAAYLASAVGTAEEMESLDAEVKSRLLDQLVDEERILAEAARQGLALTEADPNGLDRVLLQRKFQQEVILKGVAVSDDEVEAYFRAHIDEFRKPAQAVLRMLLMDDRRQADRVRAELVARPGEFETIAAAQSLSPDGGRAQSYEEPLLPDSLRRELQSLQPGQVSPVIEDPQGLFIVRLEGRQPASEPALEEVRDALHLKLLSERSESRYQEFLADLRGRMPATIHEDRLPFPYVRQP